MLRTYLQIGFTLGDDMKAVQPNAYEITYLPIGELIPYARNARTHSDAQVAQIAASIKEFGWTNPVLIDAEGGIIAGHGRVLAARKLALDVVPTIALAHLTEAQRRAYIIADNKLALNAGWDEELLKVEFAELEAVGFDLTLTGFDGDELVELMGTGEGGADVKPGKDDERRNLLLIEFDNEAELEAAFDELSERGWQVKVME